MLSPDDTRTIPKRELYLTIAVPAVAFGGILLAIALMWAGWIPDAGRFGWGCVAASFLLAYLAYIKPRRDIVSLCAPFYAIIIFVVPLEIEPNLLMQVLFALSISLLLVRLHLRYSTPAPRSGDVDPMISFLDEYIERIRPMYRDIKPTTAHEIATTFLSYKFGLYGMAAGSAAAAAGAMGTSEPDQVLKNALLVVQERATNLENAVVTTATQVSFEPSQYPYLAIVLPKERVEEPDMLKIENSLMLIYAVAYTTATEDEQALDEQQNYVVQIIMAYKKALNL
jgi:hypothetical protein